MESVLRLLRVVRVGLVYLTWGVTVAAVTKIVVPAAAVLGLSRGGEDLLTQRWLHRVARIVVRVAVAVRAIEVSFDRTERLAGGGPRLLVANHPTTFDATLIVALLPQLDTVVEMSWAEAPVVGPAVTKAGYLRNDSPRTVVEEGARRLAGGRCLLIFPEGSRSPAGKLHPFQRGAARIALAGGCDLTPVVIRSEPPIGLKGKAWYDIPKDTPKMTVAVGEPIPVSDLFDEGDSRGVAARKINAKLREYFLRELNYADV